ncbi:MAG TPA: RHS repeat-associated core domain-containing protein [Acidobacteriaceae bacterium]
MRFHVICATVAFPVLALAQTTNSSAPPHKHRVIFGKIADPAETARARSVGKVRNNASRPVADKSIYDGSGRLGKVFEPDVQGKVTVETDFSYNAAGKLVAVNQLGPKGSAARARTFFYGVNGRVTEESSPEQGTVLYTYDANGNMATKTDARGVTITYSWDNQNRLTAKAYSDGSPRAEFSYRAKDVPESKSYLQGMSGSELERVQLYNSAGGIDSVSQTFSDKQTYTVSLSYDKAGRITGLSYPDGRVLSQSWDGKSHLRSIREDKAAYFSDAHYGNGTTLLDAMLGETIRIRSKFGDDGRLSELAAFRGDTLIFGHFYGYKANGSVYEVQDTSNDRAVYFSYDQFNRVKRYRDSEEHEREYSYDEFGNLTDGESELEVGKPDPHNRLQSPQGFTYADAGEMTSDGKHRYAYNAEDRIANVDDGKVRYTYDAEGNLIGRVTAAGTEDFFWLQGQLLAERNTDGTWTDFIYVNGQRMAAVREPNASPDNTKREDEVTYFLTDRLGLARAAITSDGRLKSGATFSPFGQVLEQSGEAPNSSAESISFAGELHDQKTGLDVYQFRSYSSRLGRWMSPDPSGLRFASLSNPQTAVSSLKCNGVEGTVPVFHEVEVG